MIFRDNIKKYIRIEWILVILSLLGLGGGIYMVIMDRRTPAVQTPVMEPSAPPYAHYIAASGIIEPEGGNYYIGAAESGIVEKVIVSEGDLVKKGDPLFVIDTRQAQADVALKTASLAEAQAKMSQANVALKNKKALYDMVKSLTKGAISREEIMTRRDNWAAAVADLNVAKAAIEAARAELDAARIRLDLLTVRAPLDGQILQVNIGEGEFTTASGGDSSSPPILFGQVNKYQIRVSIDENDAWRFKPGASAVAYVRGNTRTKIPLTYCHYDPYVIPKTNLTGMPTEKVDVRVLQVVYAYDPTGLMSYIGQQVDVYIDAPQ